MGAPGLRLSLTLFLSLFLSHSFSVRVASYCRKWRHFAPQHTQTHTDTHTPPVSVLPFQLVLQTRAGVMPFTRLIDEQTHGSQPTE